MFIVFTSAIFLASEWLNHTVKIICVSMAALVVASAVQAGSGVAVGYINGSLEVSGGSASYSIPIAVPPGIAGMEPVLSVNYSSQLGNGLLGRGWNLSGLSVIYRCASNVAQDGAKKDIQFNSDDNYCLDGQRLVPVKGVKGRNGTEYRTETDSFSKIVSNGAVGNGPGWFKIWSKSGQVMEFGNTADSRIEAQGKSEVMTWAVNKISDTAGNDINFEYTEITANSEFVPKRISYGPNGSVQARFEYAEVVDLSAEKLAGSNFKVSKRLNSITTYVGSDLVQRWNFEFVHQAKQPSKLTSVQVCDSENNCLEKTTFEWQEHERKIYTTPEPDFVDFNGDGLADRYKYRFAMGASRPYSERYRLDYGENYNEYHIQLNGDRQDSGHYMMLDNRLQAGFKIWMGIAEHGPYGAGNLGKKDCEFFDIDDDGRADLNCSHGSYLSGDESASRRPGYPWRQLIRKADLTRQLQQQAGITLLNRVINNTVTELEYAHISDSNVHTRSSDVPEVRGQMFLVKSVTTDDGVGGTNTTRYRYGNAKQDRTGRGFSGFAWIEETDLTTGTKERTDYRQEFPFVGMPKQVRTYLADSTLISESNTEYTDRTSANGKVHFPHVTTSSEKSYERDGTLVSTITTANSGYDDYGNLGQIEVTTTAAGESFKKLSTNVYENDITKWHLGRLTNSEVLHTHADGTTRTRKSSFAYDSSTGFLNKEIVEPGNANAVTTRYQYDSKGNKTQVTTQVLGQTPRSITTAFDVNGQFPVSVSNDLRHSSTTVTEPKYGNVISQTGPNGLTSTSEYDGFGNAIRTTRADGTQSTVETLWADACPTTVTSAAYCVITKADGSAPVEKYLDKLNRTIRVVSIGFNGRKVYTDTRYNNLGQVAQVSRPYYAGDAIIWATTTYDDMGRTLQVTEPGPDGTTKTRSVAYNGLTTVHTNDAGHQKTSVTNALGKIVSIQEPEGASAIYTYDPLGNLIKTRDAQGNETAITYDLFGRKTGMNDPDMGIWQYSYNGYGELISQTDAKGQTSTMTYDVLGRMISRTEAEGTSNWEYDTAANGIGKLAKVTGPNGYEQTLTYDSLGRLMGSTTLADARSLTITNEYDQYSRVKKQIRPQGFITENVYNDMGYLQAVRAPKSRVADYQAGHVFEELAKLIARGMSQAQTLALEAADLRAKAQQYTDQANALYDNHSTVQQLRAAVNTLSAEAAELEKRADKYLVWVSALASHPTYGPVIRQSLVTHRQAWEASPEHYRRVTGYADTVVSQNFTRFIPITTDSRIIFIPTVDMTDGVPAADKINYIRFYGEELRHQAATKRAAAASKMAKVASRNFDSLSPEDKVIVSEANSLEQQAELALTEAALVDARINELEKVVQSDAAAQNDDAYVYFWRARERDASGRLIDEVYGNGITSEYTYNTSNGLMTRQRTGLLSVQDIRHLAYQYDNLNNIIQRLDLVNNAQESFTYDGLDRLQTSQVTSQLQGNVYSKAITYAYDTLGNITHKSDIGDYHYGTGMSNGAGPHAVIAAGSNRYHYDANGNMISGAGRTIQWSSFNKPVKITREGNTIGFTYAPDRSRYLKTGSDGSKTLYLGKMYELTTKGQAVTHRQFIYAGSELVAQQETGLDAQGQNKPVQTRYMHRDNLGSVDTVTDGVGNVVERMSFNPFGERRPGNWRETTPGISLVPVLTNRGFTGHETLDSVGLIHMNGRVYDATLGRFLNADPNIQAPYATQSFNRYSYALNNPLKYTDPSGFIWKAIKKTFKSVGRFFKKVFANRVFRAVASIVAAAVIGPTAAHWYRTGTLGVVGAGGGGVAAVGAAGSAGISSAAAVFGGAVAGFTGALIASGGDIQSALVSGLTGGAAGYIGASSTFGVPGEITASRIAAHGFTGGLSAKIQGGKFASGFISSAFVKAVSRPIHDAIGSKTIGQRIQGAIAAGVIGGTASRMGGGSFANGAKAAAFIRLLSEASRYYEETVGRKANPLPGENNVNKNNYDFDKETGQQFSNSHKQNVIGLNEPLSGDFLEDLPKQGAFVSKVLNIIPTMNATAGLHDYWFNKPDSLNFTIWNVPTMLPAAGISIAASIGNYTHGNETMVFQRLYLDRLRGK